MPVVVVDQPTTSMLHAAALAAVAGLLMALTPLAAAMPWQVCGNSTAGNYTASSTYAANLRQAAAVLTSNVSTSPSFYAVITTGTAPNRVYALGQCRGDQDASTCRSCIAASFGDAQRLCPSNRRAAIFYNSCLIGFSDADFLASPNNLQDQQRYLYNTESVSTDIAGPFNGSAYDLLGTMAEYVATTNAAMKFVTGAIGFDETYPYIYGMASCAPDLTHGQCRGCLDDTIAKMAAESGQRSKGARIWGLRCTTRYEVYRFYNGSIMLPLPGIQAGKKTDETGKIIAIVLPTTIVAIVSSLTIWICFWSRRKSKGLLSFESHVDFESIESLLVDLSTIRMATNNFAENNKLGEGGFGAVYKGSLPHSQEIAVKRLSQNSRQGIGELKNELLLIAKLQHKNLVRLVGVCLQEEEKILVYEYMPNTSLDTFLFDSVKQKELGWSKRFAIINGIARGLQYLHEDSQLKIVHRDLKASNILLDADMNPKISDFGLARLFGGDQSQDTTNRVVGTYGYMAPEYALRGQYSIKSDIYSFGVLILEIITGRRNSDSYNSDQAVDLPSFVWENWTMKTVMEIVDPYLKSDSLQEDEILRCIHIGLSCVQEDPVDRPAISAISIMLDDSSMVPSQAPSRPAFYIEMIGNGGSGMFSQAHQGILNDSTTKSILMSPNELSVTDPEPR